MIWEDLAFVIDSQKYGDNRATVTLFTHNHGKKKGLISLGKFSSNGGLLIPGTGVHARWQGRLPQHLGRFTLEQQDHVELKVLRQPHRFHILQSMCALLALFTLENENTAAFFDHCKLILKKLATPAYRAYYLSFEFKLLEFLGFALDLSKCALTGAPNNLAYLSPKSGRAASLEAAHSLNKNLLFKLPDPLLDIARGAIHDNYHVAEGEWSNTLNIFDHFLNRNILLPLGLNMPKARKALGTSAEDLPLTHKQH